ncbi:unnamed protein product [Adineta steineri]|uniref:Uncharacterized protein n=1 Tax=Adineta steineri TaxID=433720 RepID=A0A819S7K0_9BILA|nr:unnamed protein product [Adineta steineri]
MSNRDDENLQHLCQFLVSHNAASGTLQFDKSEFSRLPDDANTMSQLTPEDLKQVADALYHSLTVGPHSMMIGTDGGSVQFIAAQFKNMNMRESKLEPKVIEVALKKIIDNLDQYPQLTAFKCRLSYNENGSMAAKGVRTFCVKGRL